MVDEIAKRVGTVPCWCLKYPGGPGVTCNGLPCKWCEDHLGWMSASRSEVRSILERLVKGNLVGRDVLSDRRVLYSRIREPNEPDFMEVLEKETWPDAQRSQQKDQGNLPD